VAPLSRGGTDITVHHLVSSIGCQNGFIGKALCARHLVVSIAM
jgi:hypothetical protein